MKGSIGYDKKLKRYYVSWYHGSKTRKIWFYKGLPLTSQDLAERCLTLMRSDQENKTFNIEKYTQRASEIVPYLEKWLETVKETMTPATYRDYRSSIKNHLKPFFNANPELQLHDLQYDVLMRLVGSIKRSGKGKLNVMYCLHACLVYARESNRIFTMPKFPKRSVYQIVDPPVKWLSSERQKAVLDAIPLEHQPIFWWLKYHLRRPSEAMALLKEDFNGEVFTVCRGFSAKIAVNRTKTGKVHIVPMVSAFLPHLKAEEAKQKKYGIISPYLFVNPSSRKKGKHYTLTFLEKLWNKVCESIGEDIHLYAGTKHSTASQMINEMGYSESQLQMAGDWARLDSVRKYCNVEATARKALLEGKIIQIRSERNRNEIAGTSNEND